MAIQQVSDNQFNSQTVALIKTLRLSGGVLELAPYTTTQRDAISNPAFGTLVYDSTEDLPFVYVADATQGLPGWVPVGAGGPHIGDNSIIRTNGSFIAENLTVGPIANGGDEYTYGFSVGNIVINSGYAVTVEAGSSWEILGNAMQN